ncbi:MAG: M48 family metalloprotease [Pseudonocardiales bacterium]|nr:M48 family metalloprotease [Pseudonocardiales bacterium]MBV9029159.1 M48 family metalloprotease [Pseudonocardiales bacterium]
MRQLVTELALEMQTQAPTQLWLTSQANASVYGSRRLLRSPRRSWHLSTGVPLLVGLTTEQLRAVLCHELAHYARRHAFFSAMAYRGSTAQS